ncbi:MAG: hypothetical protein SGI90_13750 [Candidatus Eisenbacteria bacterium]|nr:hypothetical protein [Candidatus Eisenbacteria bacterium]
MKKLIVIVALALMIPALAQAMTIAEVIKLSKSGIGDEVVLSQIDASDQVFTLTVDDILELKKSGVSDRIITYMINTGKDDEIVTSENPGEPSDQVSTDRYHGNLDDYYRGYHDSSLNLFLSWGWGGYYSPSWHSYWPGYSGYYYPSYWCGASYYPYPYYHYDNHHGSYRAHDDGRNLSGRGASGSEYRRESKGSTRQAVSRAPREYKGSTPSYGGRGGSAGKPGGSSGTTQGGRTSKPPAYSGTDAPSGRQAPAPNVGSPRTDGNSPAPSPGRGSAPAPSNGSGRTMKGS